MRLQLKSMPKLLFAHSFRATQYRANIQPYANRVEISVVTEGSVELVQNGVRRVAHSGDLICNLHHGALHVTANAPHSHHTVCFEVLFECRGRFTDGSIGSRSAKGELCAGIDR